MMPHRQRARTTPLPGSPTPALPELPLPGAPRRPPAPPGSPAPPAPAPSSAVLRPEGDRVCAHETFCLGPRIAGLFTDSREQFRVTGNFQPRWRRGVGGHRQKVTLARRLPDSCRLGSRSGGGGGAGRPGEWTGPLVPPAVPSQPRRPGAPPAAAPARPAPLLCESRLFFSGCDFQVA